MSYNDFSKLYAPAPGTGSFFYFISIRSYRVYLIDSLAVLSISPYSLTSVSSQGFCYWCTAELYHIIPEEGIPLATFRS